LVQLNKAVGESYLKLSGNLLKHVDTISVARDHEAVRQALGDEKLNLAGFSYGTQLATQYAELFPDRVGRFVLDGNLDHSGSGTYTLVTEVSTYENELDRFAAWCGSSKDCALHGKDVAAEWDKLVQKADKTPIPALACDGTTCRKDVTGEELRFNAQGYLIFKPLSWTILGQALAEAIKGNATILSTPLAVSGQAEANSALFGERAVVCLDWGSSADLSDILYKQQLAASIAPHTQGATQTYDAQTRCIGWPAPVNNPPREAHFNQNPPRMLMVNALYDPETSYTWAVALREQIPGAVLLTRNGDGKQNNGPKGNSNHAVTTWSLGPRQPAYPCPYCF
jgi:pimeloyl-ACP methyl ester carboxylesterase